MIRCGGEIAIATFPPLLRFYIGFDRSTRTIDWESKERERGDKERWDKERWERGERCCIMGLRGKRRTNRPNRRLIPFSMPDMKLCWVRKSEYGCLHRLLYTNTFCFYMCVDGIYSRIKCDSDSWRIWKRDAVACRRLRCWNQVGGNGCIILNGTRSSFMSRNVEQS